MTNSFRATAVRFVVATLAIIGIYLLIKYLYGMLSTYIPKPGDTPAIGMGFNHPQKFIEHGYPEIKALSVQLLTLLTAILVFSVTFSEKVINFSQANYITKIALIAGWVFIILALISDGIGLAYNALALPFAISDVFYSEKENINSVEFYGPAFNSLFAIVISGAFFILGLICIVLSGVLSVFKSQVRV